MMFFHFAFLLCWAIIAIIAVRGQQIDQNIAAATVNIPASTSDKIVVAGEALLARWADVRDTLKFDYCLLTVNNSKMNPLQTLNGKYE
jgi:hypothetical protein